VTPDDAPALLPLTRVRPEHVNDLEVGASASMGRLGLSVNLFDMRFRDEIARTGATTPLGYDIRANVGRSYRRGAEFEATLALTGSLDLNSSLTLSRNRIEEYRDEGAGTVYRDVEPILTPFLASQQLTWRAWPALTLTVDSRYQGLSYLAPTGDERLTSPAFHVLDTGARYRFGGTTIGMYGRNLLNRRAFPSGDVSGAGEPRYFILSPRSVDLSVTIVR
jgi:outer membrane receptor protein involved in Fe transport